MVGIYYSDAKGRTQLHCERWSKKEYAQDDKERYEKYIGQWWDGIDFQGTIISVYTYKCRQCTIA